MNVSSFKILNYRSIEKLKLGLNEGINIFIGKNNTGKSNILNSFETIRQISSLDFNGVRGYFEKHDSFANTTFAKRLPSIIGMEFEFRFSDQDRKKISEMFPEWDEYLQNLDSVKYLINLKGNGGSYPQVDFEKEDITLVMQDQEIVLAKASWTNRSYSHQILKNLKQIQDTDGKIYDNAGGSSPGRSLLYGLESRQTGAAIEYLPALIARHFQGIAKLDPFRDSPESADVEGTRQLSAKGTNLPQVLNTLASSDRMTFDSIIDSSMRIIEGISNIGAPLIQGESTTYLSTSEKSFPGIEFRWDSVSSGERQILNLVTLLHTAPKGGMIMIEEPELHLHSDALTKLMSLMEEISKNDNKQILITTHSSTLVDINPLQRIFVTIRENGATNVIPLKGYHEISELLSKGGIRNSSILVAKQSRFLLIVEGRDDVKVWRQFLIKAGLEPDENRIVIIPGLREKGQGRNEAILVAKLLLRLGISIPWKLILDSDARNREVTTELDGHSIPKKNFHVLRRKELESYLINVDSLSALLHLKPEQAQQFISKSKSTGKETLDNIFELSNVSRPNSNVKELLAANLPALDPEISALISEIRSEIPA